MRDPREDILSVDHLKAGLKERAVRGAGFTIATQIFKLILQIISISVMARLLQPSDFGLVAMVAVFTGVALQFMEGGLSMATIQRDLITHAQVSNLFWANTLLGAGLCLLGMVSAPLIAGVYSEPRLIPITVGMSLIFFVGGLSVQHDAILRRQMRFRAISLIDISSMAFGVIAGIIAAFGGWGYWALVIGPLVTFLVKTALRWAYSEWRPSMMSRASGVRPLLAFGANLTGANFIGYVASNITPFAVGYVSGAHFLGMYNRANSLTSIPSSQLLPPVISVLQPAISRISAEPDTLRRTLIAILGKLSLVSIFITAASVVFADWVVLIILGSGWAAAVPMLQWLSLFSFIQPTAGLIAVALIAKGEGRVMMLSKIHSLAITVVAVMVGSNWGVLGIVAAFSLSGLFLRLPLFSYYASRFLPVTFADLVKPLLPALISAALAAALTVYLKSLIQFSAAINGLLTLLPVFAITYLTLCLSFPSIRKDLLSGLKTALLSIRQRPPNSPQR